ncbi:MAG: sulfatase-like hydrolase/transferase [Planctomycetota bacterium]|jgi:arylsulfatase A-like enzyme
MKGNKMDIFSRQTFLKFTSLTLAAVLILPVIVLGEEGCKPNVVIMFTDDQGTLDANCYGSKDLYTPTMDKLAETGVKFTQAYAHTVCCPARAPMLTGRHPQRCGVNTWMQEKMTGTDNKNNMFREEITLAEVLKKEGYKTALFGKWHLGASADNGPTKQGFDEFFGLRNGFIDNYNHYQLHGKGFHDLFEGTTEVFYEGEYFPDLMMTRALEFIERNRREQFFLYLGFNIPHYPEQSDKKFDERYAGLEEPRRSYAKIVSTTDDKMGRVVDKLEELGLRENTIIVFMSDNGHSEEENQILFDDHNSGLPKGANYGANGGGGNTGKWRGHKGQFFEGGIRVPAIISYPARLPKGIVRDQAIIVADWFPTILELCGIEPPDVKLDGLSVLPIIKNEKAKARHDILYWQWEDLWAVREGDWKLIGKEQSGFFLGNLADQIPEGKNHLREKPKITERLTMLHEEWFEEVMLKKSL